MCKLTCQSHPSDTNNPIETAKEKLACLVVYIGSSNLLVCRTIDTKLLGQLADELLVGTRVHAEPRGSSTNSCSLSRNRRTMSHLGNEETGEELVFVLAMRVNAGSSH